MRVLAARNGVPHMNGSVQEKECASGENSGPGTHWRDGYYWNRKNGANRARTSASSVNSSSRTGWSSNGGENDERGVHQLEENRQVSSVEEADAVIESGSKKSTSSGLGTARRSGAPEIL